MDSHGRTRRLLLGLTVAFLIGCLFLTVSAALLSPVSSGAELPISTVQALAGAGHIESAVIHDADHRITGTYVPAPKTKPLAFWTEYPAAETEFPALVDRLSAGGATVVVDPQNGKAALGFFATFMVPALLLLDVATVLVLLLRLGRARLMPARARETPSSGTRSEVTFADVAGNDAALAQLAEAAAYLRDPSASPLPAGQQLRGVLIHGPPGCGKTLLAQAVAGEAKAPFVPLSDALARPAGRRLVLVENADQLGTDDCERLLRLLDTRRDGDALVVVATARHVEKVPAALLETGRLDRRVAVQPPDPSERLAILTLHARGRALEPPADLRDVAQRSTGLTGADLVAVVAEAARLTTRAGRQRIGPLDFDDALQHIAGSSWRRGHLLSADERRRAAAHEAGHAVVAAALGRGRLVQRLSILVHFAGAGVALPGNGREVRSRSDLLAELTILCGGLAAEELYFDEPSTAVESDLEAATSLAIAVAGRYGMSSRLGRVQLAGDDAPELLTGALRDDFTAEVRRLIDDATAAATDRLQRCHEPLVDLVLQLERDESVDSVELSDILIRALEAEIEGMADTVPGAPEAAPAEAPAPPANR